MGLAGTSQLEWETPTDQISVLAWVTNPAAGGQADI